jgi:hypothetical protein
MLKGDELATAFQLADVSLFRIGLMLLAITVDI